jgi:carbamoyltransferase
MTGIASILNTSFNLHGYPMVDSLQRMLWTLENSKLDGAFIWKLLSYKVIIVHKASMNKI